MTNKATRYLPKHTHYLPDAQLLIRELQKVTWPLNYHVCLGGGVLNHGYSDKDIDLYLLPIYPQSNAKHNMPLLLSSIKTILGVPDKDYDSAPPSLPAGIGATYMLCNRTTF